MTSECAPEAGFDGPPEPNRPGGAAVDPEKWLFSRERCLSFSGGEDDRWFAAALIGALPPFADGLALAGPMDRVQYLLELLQEVPALPVCCILDAAGAGGELHGVPIISPAELPPSVTVFNLEPRWTRIARMTRELPQGTPMETLDTLARLNPGAVPARAWVPRIKSIYPIELPEIRFQPGMDVILIDLPARSIAQMPAGFAYVHNALKRMALKCQTLDLDIILYHRYHMHRLLDGLTELTTSSGKVLPEDPWQPVHYLEWETPEFVDFFAEDIEEIVSGLIAARPKVIAFSLQQVNLSITRRVVQAVRRGLPEVRIVVGGMSCLQPSAAKFVFPDADYTVVGEADLTIGPLAEALARGECPRDLPGVWSRFDTEGHGFVPGPLPMRLDELEFPHYEWTDIQLYRNWNGYQLTPVIASRGCSWARCNFCGERFKWRTRSPLPVADEMEWLYQQGFRDFVFNESNLHGDPQVTERLCDEIIRRGLKITMAGQLRCHPKVGEAYYRKLRQAGFTTLRFGVDAASDNTLKRQNKGYTKEIIRRTLRDATRAGIYVQINLVVGVPGETEQDIDETISFLAEAKDDFGVLEFINPLMLFRGSEYWDHPEKFDITFNEPKESLYSRYLVAIPDHQWQSNAPFIDRKVRYDRFLRVVTALRSLGVPMGAFANFTSDKVAEKQASADL